MKKTLLKRSKRILYSHGTRRIDGGTFYESFVRLLHCVPLFSARRGPLSLLYRCPSHFNASWVPGTEKMLTIPISKVEEFFELFSSCLLIHNASQSTRTGPWFSLSSMLVTSHVHRKVLSSASFGPMKTAARLACVFGLGDWHEWPIGVSPSWFRCLGRRQLSNGNDPCLMEGLMHRNLE